MLENFDGEWHKKLQDIEIWYLKNATLISGNNANSTIRTSENCGTEWQSKTNAISLFFCAFLRDALDGKSQVPTTFGETLRFWLFVGTSIGPKRIELVWGQKLNAPSKESRCYKSWIGDTFQRPGKWAIDLLIDTQIASRIKEANFSTNLNDPQWSLVVNR